MLKAIRQNAKIFLYLLIAAFILWLIFDVLNFTRVNPYAGKIFNKAVPINEFQKAYTAARTKAIFTYGDKIREIKNLDLENDAWDRLILLYETKKKKLSVSDKEVVSFIKNLGIFQEKTGKFSRRFYDELLRYSLGLTPAEFEEQIRQDLAIQKLIDKQNRIVEITDEEVLKEYKLANEKVKISYILFKAQDYLAQVTATDDEIKAFFEQNRANFTIPSQVNVQYFGKPFSNETEEEKQKIRREIKDISYEFAGKNEDLDGVAKKFSISVKETGFFDRESQIPDIGWDIDFADTALSLEQGKISSPVETKTGIYILKVKGIKPPRPAELTEVKEKVENELEKQKAENIAKTKAAETLATIETRLENKEQFEEIAKSLSLPIKETEPFDRVSYIEGLGMSPSAAKAAFSLKEGGIFNEPVKAHDGYAIIRRIAFIPIDDNKYSQEKDKFEEQLLAQKRYLNFLTWFEELKKQANLTSNLDDLGKKK